MPTISNETLKPLFCTLAWALVRQCSPMCLQRKRSWDRVHAARKEVRQGRNAYWYSIGSPMSRKPQHNAQCSREQHQPTNLASQWCLMMPMRSDDAASLQGSISIITNLHVCTDASHASSETSIGSTDSINSTGELMDPPWRKDMP
jgi:hypothetical protein